MKKGRYFYPAVFNYADDGISIEFPDLPGCLPCAHTDEESLKNAQEAMALHLMSMEDDGDEIPEPSKVQDIEVASNETVMLIEVYLPKYRATVKQKFIKKTLTIPQWLNDLALDEGLNFSQVLQSALKDKLGVSK